MRIITLTSIPPRFARIAPTLRSLLAQAQPADRIELYIPRRYRRFPDWDGAPPPVPDGITLIRPDHDYGPASKILHAVRAWRGKPVDLLFCDDDRHYAPDWTGAFLAARKIVPKAAIAPISWSTSEMFGTGTGARPQPQAIRANRRLDLAWQARHLAWSLGHALGRRVEGPSHAHIRTAGYRDIFQGYGGVMVRPDFFDNDVFDIPPVLWSVDDIWLSGMLAKAGTPIWAPAGIKGPRLLPAHDAAPLYEAVIDGADRKTADRACFDHMRDTFGVWP